MGLWRVEGVAALFDQVLLEQKVVCAGPHYDLAVSLFVEHSGLEGREHGESAGKGAVVGRRVEGVPTVFVEAGVVDIHHQHSAVLQDEIFSLKFASSNSALV